MIRPVGYDLFLFLLPLAAGATLFVAGRSVRRWPRPVRVGLVGVAVAAVVVGGLSLARVLPDEIEAAFSRIGGLRTTLAWAALFLLGAASATPGGSFTPGFVRALAYLAGFIVAVEAGGPVWWRYRSPELWDRTPDPTGHLVQSGSPTCSPVAAAMLLHEYGITASEGEMAYLAGTSLFGTDAHGTARAVRAKVEDRGWTAVAERTTYDECARRGGPFVAHLGGDFIGHAVLILRATPDQVVVRDPGEDRDRVVPRPAFERDWDGTAIRVVRPD